MIPNSCQLFACPVDLSELLADMVGWWNDVEGFDMSHMAQVLLRELRKRPMHHRAVDARAVLAPSHTVCHFDLTTLQAADLERITSNALHWQFDAPCTAHALCLHFSVAFPDNTDLCKRAFGVVSQSAHGTFLAQPQRPNCRLRTGTRSCCYWTSRCSWAPATRSSAPLRWSATATGVGTTRSQ